MVLCDGCAFVLPDVSSFSLFGAVAFAIPASRAFGLIRAFLGGGRA